MLPEIIKYLATAGQCAPSADNSQPWQFYWDGEYFTIQLTENNSGIHSLEKDHPAMILSLGCVTENILQALEFIGKSHIKPDFLPDQLAVRFKVIGEDYLYEPKKQDNNHPLFFRHTNRFPFKKIELSSTIKTNLLQLSKVEAKISIFNTKAEINFWAELIKQASQLRFQSPDIHEWLGSSLRLSETAALSNDGLDAKTLDLPPGGKLLLSFTKPWPRMNLFNHIGLYKLFSMVESMQIKKTGGLICITAPLSIKGIFHAGILMERAWIYLNHNELSVHPYYVLSDQIYRFYEDKVPTNLIPDIAKIVDIIEKKGFGKTNHLQIIFRVGIATKNPPLSRRHKATVIQLN